MSTASDGVGKCCVASTGGDMDGGDVRTGMVMGAGTDGGRGGRDWVDVVEFVEFVED
jgi:hypothetical protein